jgi:ferredoxin-NADP reductase
MNETVAAPATRLARHEDVADGTMAFHFAKPAGFDFKAGQAVEVLLADPAGGANDIGHAFSIVSAPFEDELVFATRMRDSAYKKALKALAPGAEVRLDGPFGSLTLHNKRARPAVFVAGGIGITPFMSILRQAAHDRLDQDLMLLYSNRRPEDAAFLGELQALERANPRFRLVATMTEMAGSARAWNGQTGPLDAATIRAAVTTLPNAIFYLAGPPAMVAALRHTLIEAGVDEDDIRTEEFLGY